jgi:hypothetical protein
VERKVEIEEGEGVAVLDHMFDEKVVIVERPPNQVREEADMPTPVLVTAADGQASEKWVKKGAAPKQNAVPKHNKVKGV